MKKYVTDNGTIIFDVSNKKPIADIESEFGSVTEVEYTEPTFEKDVEADEKEALIRTKIRSLAIEELKKEGKLDVNGNVKK